MRLMQYLGVVLLLLVPVTSRAQTADTLHSEHSVLSAREGLLIGGFVAGAVAAAPADRFFTRELQDDARQASRFYNKGATVFRLFGQPGALFAGGGLYIIGLASENRRAEDLGLHSMEAIFIGSAITGATKIIAGRARPRISKDNARNFGLFRGLKGDNYESFPSGHTTAAFAFASLVTAETSHWNSGSRWIVGPLMYGAATLTGVSRIYNNAHWASDVIAGAAVGTLTGIKVYQYQHSHPDNWLDKRFLRAGVSVSNNGGLMPILSITKR